MKKTPTPSRQRPRRQGAAKRPAAHRSRRDAELSLAKALSAAPLLRGTPLALARELVAQCRQRRLAAKELLLRPGRPNATLYLLLSGRLHVLLGEAQDTIVQMYPGACVGEMSVVDGARVSAPVAAAAPSTVLAIDTRRFWRFAERYPVLARNLLTIMAQRVRKTNAALQASLHAHEREGRLARLDALTAAHNRRWLDENLPKYLERARHRRGVLVVAMFDIDHFKRYNDTWGHAAGDAALKAVARAVLEHIRADDRLCRYGGEEFCLLLPDTAPEVAPKLAQRLLAAIAATSIPSGTGNAWPAVTASLGLAAALPDDTPASLLHRADQALYRAKHGGRNRFVLDSSLVRGLGDAPPGH